MLTSRDSITIRPALETDAQAYRSLRLDALRNHPEAFSADYATNAARPETYWVDRLRSLGSEGMMFFAFHNTDLIGMCGIYRNDTPKTRHGATIVSVYVQPEWRGLQIADKMIDACVAWARAQAITIVRLAVGTSNVAAIRCYARCGFHVYGIEPQSICVEGKFVDELLMAREL